MKGLKAYVGPKVGVGVRFMELRIFTLPTCSCCPLAKTIAAEVAHRSGLAFREVDMATEEGLNEALANGIKSTPSIALGEDVIVRGRVISKGKLEEEVRIRLERWKKRAVCDSSSS